MKQFKALLALGMTCLVTGNVVAAIAQEYQPQRRGTPQRREGAGTRMPDRCITGNKPIMPLTPSDNFGTTTSKTPVLFWYIPQTSAKTAELRIVELRGNQEEELYTTSIPLQQVPGLVMYRLPAELAAKLQTDKTYDWQFSLICSPEDPSRNPFIEGRFQLINTPAAVQTALKTAKTPRDRATVYAKAGIWYDAIATLAASRCNQPKNADLQAGWLTLLKSVKLENYAQEPLPATCAAIGAAK